MAEKLKANQLTPGGVALIKGKLTYSHVVSQIDGEALENAKQRAQQNGSYPPMGPYTTATICEATLLPKDASNLTDIETFVAQRCFISQKNPGQNFTGENKGKFTPAIGVKADAPAKGFRQIWPTSELQRDQEVILVLRCFKGNPNNGVSLDAVLVCETEDNVKFFGNGGAQGMLVNALKDYGIPFEPTPNPNPNASEAAKEPEAPSQETLAEKALKLDSSLGVPVAAPEAAAETPASAPVPAGGIVYDDI